MWSPSACSGNVALRVSYEAFLSLDERQIGAVKLSVSSESSVEIILTDVLDGHSADRTSGVEPRFFPPRRAILTSLKPNGVDNVTAYIYSTVRGDLPQFQKGLSSDPDTKSISQSYSVTIDPEVNAGMATFVKYVGVMSTDHFPDAKALIIKAVDRAAATGWEALHSAHTAQVGALMHSDFLPDFRDPARGALPEDSDIRSLQITAISSVYYLYTSLLPHEESDAARSDRHENSLLVTHAISADLLPESGCASWTFLLKSFLPFVRTPWYQLSEPQSDNPGTESVFPFLTGHSDLLQAVTAGLLGLRTTGASLVLNPSLPPQLAHFRAPLQFYNGAVIECRVNRTHTTVTRRDAAAFEGVAEDRYGDGAMPITVGRGADDPEGYEMHLNVGETVVIANRQYGGEPAETGNILQCKPSSSTVAHVSGQFPIAATDGHRGTSWQPESDAAASLVVDLTQSADQPSVELDHILLDFATRPPKQIRVLLSNDSSFAEPPEQQQPPLGEWVPVVVSSPWVADSPVVQHAGNTTIVDLPRGVWSGRYARLDVEGCWAEDGAGPTVAEFALIARGAGGPDGGSDAVRTAGPGENGHDEL